MNRFSKTQIYLHWITLFFVAITYVMMELCGWFPRDSSTYLLMRGTHYNAGIFVWVLTFSHLIIKHRYGDPSTVPPPSAWQMKAASLMHIMLCITFLTLPLPGIALMAYSGKSWSFLGFNVPPFVTPNSEIKALIKNTHETWASIGYFLIAAHAGAALFHHYIQKDSTLLRMMPRRK